jgi:hypothetical protein
MSEWTTTGLWLAVVASGIYHGINPGMGWPLAVSAGLLDKRAGQLFRALGLLAVGHFLAMIGILMPFGAMLTLVLWERQIRIVAGLVVVAAGVYLLINRRHPRVLARIPPAQLALWSFAAATARKVRRIHRETEFLRPETKAQNKRFVSPNVSRDRCSA